MSQLYSRTIYTLSALLLFVLLGGPQMAQAWAMPQQQSAQTQTIAANISKGALPDAPSASAQEAATQQQQQQAPTDQQQANSQSSNTQANTTQNKKTTAPVGAAAAEAGVTAGGAASRPAGAAIAPAKQGARRSLLIKVGLIAAGAGALGAVYALSRGTGSTPPTH